MKQLVIITALAAMLASCANSPEGSTNTDGSGASVLPEKTGDTSREKKADNGGGGEYNTDTMPGTVKVPGKDSAVISEADSGTIKLNSGTKNQPVKADSIKKKSAKTKQ